MSDNTQAVFDAANGALPPDASGHLVLVYATAPGEDDAKLMLSAHCDLAVVESAIDILNGMFREATVTPENILELEPPTEH